MWPQEEWMMDKTLRKDRIDKMIDTVMSVARGDYSIQVELSGENDELDSLAIGLNMMIDDIRTSEAELRVKDSAIASSINAITIADLEGNLTYVNPSFLKMWGYDNEKEVLGGKAVELWQMQEQAAEVIQALQEKGSWEGELTATKKDGARFDVRLSASMITDKTGKPINIMGSFIDITEHKQAEEKIQQQSEFLDTVLESLTHPFYVIDANDYTVKLANSAASVGRSSENITCYTLTHKRSEPCGSAEHSCPLEEVKKTRKQVLVEHIHYDKDGNFRNVEVHGFPIFDTEGNVIQMIEYCLDITERKKAEIEKEKLIKDLEASLERIQTLSGLIPICAWCKKIRDDKGYWESVEAYISEHTKAEFTHGMCPECADKY